MAFLLSLYANRFLIFVLVLSRVSGLVIVAPIWSSRAVPARVRALLAMGIALIVTPLCWHTPLDEPGHLIDLGLLVARDFAVGLALGLAVMLCFAGLELTGHVLGQMTGMSLADAAHPDYDTSVPIFGQFLYMLMLAVFVATGGPQRVLHTFIQLLRELPPGHVGFSQAWLESLSEIISYSFRWGLQLAAPMILALLLTMLILGLVSRTMPQLNVLAVGFGINALVVLGALLLAVGVLARLFQDQSGMAIDLIRPALARPVPP